MLTAGFPIAAYNTVDAKVNLKQLLMVLKDVKCWLFALINAGVAFGIGSVGLFLPTFVKEFGFSKGTIVGLSEGLN